MASFPGNQIQAFSCWLQKNINVDIKDSIIFEDSYSGIEAAKRSGAKKIVVIDSMKNNYAEKNNM